MATQTSDEIEKTEHNALQKDKETPSIGGSTAAVLAMEAMGHAPPYGRSAFGEWMKITGREPRGGDTDRFEMGRLMEEPISIRFQRKTGLTVEKVPALVHPVYSWVTGHIDRSVVERPADLEIKTVEYDPKQEWSEDGEQMQRVPPMYFFQAIWYAGIPRFRIPADPGIHGAFMRDIYMAAQFGLSKPLRVYHWEPDANIQAIWARMLEAAQQFWEENIIKDTPPPRPSGSQAKAW